MSLLGVWWATLVKLVGRRSLYEAIALTLVIGFYEGVPGIAWVGHMVPAIDSYLYLAEGRVPRSYYAGVNDEKARWIALQQKWEEDKRTEINSVAKDYSVAMMKLSSDKLSLTSVLEDTRKDLEDEKAKQAASGTGGTYCPPAVPSRLRNYLNSIR